MVDLSKRIAVTGPFTDINFGDYAMLVNNAYDLNASNLLLFSYDQRFLSVLKDDYFQGRDVKFAEVRLSDGLKERFVNQKKLTPFDLMEYVENQEEIRESLIECDVLVVNGGGYFNSLWLMPHRIERLAQIVAPIIVADRLGIKVVFSANGFGPFVEDSEFFACLFGSFPKVKFNCRDKLYSPLWMRQLGVSDSQLSFIPDDLLLINKDLKELKPSFSLDFKDYIVLETYLPVEFIDEHKEDFLKFSKFMRDRYGVGVVFLPFHLAHGGVDQGRFLVGEMDNFEFVDISEKGYLPIQDAVNIIGGARLVLSNRYHAVVVALQCGTPTVSVLKDVLGDKRYYYNKNRGVVDLVLNGASVDESFYFCSDYLMALDYVAENFLEIEFHQNSNYASVHSKNIQALSEIRKEFLKSV